MPRSVPSPELTLPPEGRSPAAPLNWLLIGPLARECAHWGDAPTTLLMHVQAVQPKAALFLLDLPGTGRLWRDGSPDRISALVVDLRRRVAAAGLVGPFGLVASGWASAVATEWARQHSEELGAVVLLNPGMRPFTQVLRSIGPALWGAAVAKVLGRRSLLERDRRLWNSTTRMQGASSELLATWQALRREHPFKARNGWRQLRAVWHYEASRRRPHPYVLLLAGKADAWLDWRISAAISRAWGAALRLHPDAGHDLLLDDPHWVGRSVAEWLLPVGSGGLGSGRSR